MSCRIVLFLALWMVVFCTSCNEKRPSNLPKLYPVSVKILQDSQPLANAQVSLYSEDPILQNFSPGGSTDENGVVILFTRGYKGAPEGSFKVTVNKTEITGGEESDPTASTVSSKVQTFFLVEKNYRSQGTTPLTLDIQKKKGNIMQSLDVGKGVREKDTNDKGL